MKCNYTKYYYFPANIKIDRIFKIDCLNEIQKKSRIKIFFKNERKPMLVQLFEANLPELKGTSCIKVFYTKSHRWIKSNVYNHKGYLTLVHHNFNGYKGKSRLELSKRPESLSSYHFNGFIAAVPLDKNRPLHLNISRYYDFTVLDKEKQLLPDECLKTETKQECYVLSHKKFKAVQNLEDRLCREELYSPEYVQTETRVEAKPGEKEVISYDIDSTPMFIHRDYYDKTGLKIRSRYYYMGLFKPYLLYSLMFQYNKNKQLIRLNEYSAVKKLIRIIEFNYDKKGHLKEEITIFPEKEISKKIFYYHSRYTGLLIAKTVCINNQYYSRTTYEYDRKKRLRLTEQRNKKEIVVDYRIVEYDEQGRVIFQEFYFLFPEGQSAEIIQEYFQYNDRRKKVIQKLITYFMNI